MKRFVVSTLVLASAVSLSAVRAYAADMPMPVKAVGQSTDKVWTTTATLDVRYSSWNSAYGYPTFLPPLSGDGKGAQFYVPVALMTTGSPFTNWKLDFGVRSGYVWARQSTAGLTGEASTFTDTALSGTATYTGFDGVIPFLSLNINVPTGTAALYGPDRFARMDPDLVDVATYGEGWNFAPTLGVNIAVTKDFIVTPSIGYTNRNAFTKEGPIDPITGAQGSVNFSPGDITTLSLGAAYAVGKFSINGSVAYAFESTTYQDGVAQYRAGDRVTVSGVAGYAWSDAWKSSVSGYWTYSRKNDVNPGGVNALVLEAFNSNNTVYRINLDHTYSSGSWSVGPTASYLNRDANGYSSTTFQFIPAKQRYGLGGVGSYATSATSSINLRVERIWVHESGNTFYAVPALNSQGWLVSAGGVIQF
jgi:hypothetical protein